MMIRTKVDRGAGNSAEMESREEVRSMEGTEGTESAEETGSTEEKEVCKEAGENKEQVTKVNVNHRKTTWNSAEEQKRPARPLDIPSMVLSPRPTVSGDPLRYRFDLSRLLITLLSFLHLEAQQFRILPPSSSLHR
jgi:hypothetical protein